MLLAKQPVQGILWNQLLDSQPHALAHGGLVRRARPAQADRRATGRSCAATPSILGCVTQAGDLKPATRILRPSVYPDAAEAGQAHVVALRTAADEAFARRPE